MKTKFYLSLVAMLFAALTASAEDFMYNGLAYNILNDAIHTVEVTTPTGGYTSLVATSLFRRLPITTAKAMVSL